MPRGHYLTEGVKDAVWVLRAEGVSEAEVGRRLGVPKRTVSKYLQRMGGIRPRSRRRAERCLTLAEREEISRGKSFASGMPRGAMLIVSELATNAFLRGEGAIVLSVRRLDDRLRIEVLDEGRPDRIDVVPEAHRGDGGRGLWIVEQLATSGGTVAGTGHVWAELAIGSVPAVL